ncbi:hypothetical protein C8R48DRAFT_673945 [Suillus tomentosus]|nr:hypothetical protein C8R48DRAFT_673945 [Suillus tomentosus]
MPSDVFGLSSDTNLKLRAHTRIYYQNAWYKTRINSIGMHPEIYNQILFNAKEATSAMWTTRQKIEEHSGHQWGTTGKHLPRTSGLTQQWQTFICLMSARVNEITTEEVNLFRRNYFVPLEGQCPVVLVGFIVHHSDHFFVVIFDYQLSVAHVLGQYISDSAMDIDGIDPFNWEGWQGPEYWRRIASLHGWRIGNVTQISVIHRDWTQNRVDCGPIACSVLEQCLASGLDESGDLPTFEVQCGHRLRSHMLHVIAGRIKLSCSDYLMLLDRQRHHWSEDEFPDEDTINDIQNGCHQAACLKLIHTLTVASATCSNCQRVVLSQDGRHPSLGAEDQEETILMRRI